MKEINCANVIMEERRKRGITQDEMAAHLGIVKATISKWETGASYPDISMLPLLATFFDISIDQLMGYTPQMTEEKIKEVYERLALDFTKKPFEEVIAECESIMKKYYSCYPLLLEMATLYLNHAPIAGGQEQTEQILNEAIKLCQRITANSKAQPLIWETVNIQALCYLTLGDGAAVLELIGESITTALPSKIFISQAYKLLGNEEKSTETLQAILWQQLMDIFHTMMIALQSNLSDLKKAEPIYLRAETITNTFNMKHLNANNIAMMYLLGAQMYQMGGFSEKAVALLDKYATACIKDLFPISLRGDEFFDKLDNFFAEDTNPVSRNDKAVKKDIVQQLYNPIFESLQEHIEYKAICKKLNDFAGGILDV